LDRLYDQLWSIYIILYSLVTFGLAFREVMDN
jgi:hypothetical protein